MNSIKTSSAFDGVLALTIPQTQKALGISRTTVYALFEQGKLRRVKIGARALIPIADVRNILAG